MDSVIAFLSQPAVSHLIVAVLSALVVAEGTNYPVLSTVLKAVVAALGGSPAKASVVVLALSAGSAVAGDPPGYAEGVAAAKAAGVPLVVVVGGPGRSGAGVAAVPGCVVCYEDRLPPFAPGSVVASVVTRDGRHVGRTYPWAVFGNNPAAVRAAVDQLRAEVEPVVVPFPTGGCPGGRCPR